MDKALIQPITTGIIIAVLILFGAVSTWLQAKNRSTRKSLSKARLDLDELRGWVFLSRQDRRLHNEQLHPTGAGAIPMRDFPKAMGLDDPEEPQLTIPMPTIPGLSAPSGGDHHD